MDNRARAGTVKHRYRCRATDRKRPPWVIISGFPEGRTRAISGRPMCPQELLHVKTDIGNCIEIERVRLPLLGIYQFRPGNDGRFYRSHRHGVSDRMSDAVLGKGIKRLHFEPGAPVPRSV